MSLIIYLLAASMLCQSRLQAAACAVVLVSSILNGVSAALACPFEGPELLEELQRGRNILSAEPEVEVEPAFSLDGATPIPFDWGAEEITTPAEDSFKYEAEIDEVLNDPLSDWVQIPEVSLSHYRRWHCHPVTVCRTHISRMFGTC